MDFGIHIPQIAMDDPDWTLPSLIEYAETAEREGFQCLCANDHLVFSQPWLDGPTVLAALLSYTDLTLATTISLSVIRGPVALAKTLGAIDLLSGGRLVVGVGPGSSEQDYEAVGIPFEERWPRFDESIRALRSLWNRDRPFTGQFYSTEDVTLEPSSAQEDGPPIWIGSWGSKAGLRRVARLGDGWLASGYNTTPEQFKNAKKQLDNELSEAGKEPDRFPNAIATMFFYVTSEESEATQIVRDRLAPTLGRSVEELADRLPIGSAELCAEKLTAYQEAGAKRVYLWPVKDEVEQLRIIREQVISTVEDTDR